MLTQGPPPDPKCDLNVTSFLTVPHQLHCLISAKDIMVTELLLQVMGGIGKLGVVLLCWVLGGGGGGQGVVIFFLSFVLLLIVLSWLVHDSLLCLFHCFFFAFFISGAFN